MGVKERILAIRLMEKLEMNPAAAEKLGIEVIQYRKMEGEEYGTDQKS